MDHVYKLGVVGIKALLGWLALEEEVVGGGQGGDAAELTVRVEAEVSSDLK